MPSGETTRDAIRRYLEEHGSATGPELASHQGVTRQAVRHHLRRLLSDAEIFTWVDENGVTSFGSQPR